MKPNNPFLISGYYSPEFFCDREQETGTILDALHNGRNVALIAPRRMGKTGLVRHAFYRLKEEQPDIVTFYLDTYSTQSLGDFVRLFASTVLGQLDSVPQKALSRIRQFVRSCRPVFTFDELPGVPKVTIDVAPAEEENTLEEFAWAFGDDAVKEIEESVHHIIEQLHQIPDIQRLSEEGLEELLDNWHGLGVLDEDELLRRIELHMDELPEELTSDRKLILHLLEKRRGKLKEKILAEHPEVLERLEKQNPEAVQKWKHWKEEHLKD